MSRSSTTDLTTRSDSKVLPAMGDSILHLDLLDTEAREGAWRLVEVFSQAGAPFEVELTWSSGSGAGASVRFTASRASRISVFARTLRARVGNLSSEENRVGITAADGHAVTRNVLEVTGSLLENAALEIPIPAFATGLRLELADASLLPGATIQVTDGQGVLRSSTAGDLQPSGGVHLGGAGKVEILAGSATHFRVLFLLSL
jgi:hypothetical protein